MAMGPRQPTQAPLNQETAILVGLAAELECDAMKSLPVIVLMTLPLACSNGTSRQPHSTGGGGQGGGDAGYLSDAGAIVANDGNPVGGAGGTAFADGSTNRDASSWASGDTVSEGSDAATMRDASGERVPAVAHDAKSGDASAATHGDGADAAPPDASRAPDALASPDSSPASPASILEAMRRAHDFFLTRWPDPTVDIVTDKARPSNLWTRAVSFEGLMALYAVEPDSARKQSLYDYAVRWGESPSHPWTLTYTAASTMTSNADNQCCGQTYIDLYLIEKKPERLATIKANIDNMVSRGIANAWTWIDAIQMAMPVFARLGVIESDARYFDAMWALYDNARTQQGGGLRNPVDGLWWRDLHFTPGGGTQQRMSSSLHNNIPGSSKDAYIVAPNGKDLYWSRGNGWVMAALVRVLDWLPTSDSRRATYVADIQSMAASLLPLQRSDGFWNESLLDSTHCASIGLNGQDGPETSGTALFTYGLAWGIRHGLLDGATYGAALNQAWNGLITVALQPDGLLGYVQSTGDRPCTDTGPLGPTKLANFDDYGVGAFLLAGSEMYALATGRSGGH